MYALTKKTAPFLLTLILSLFVGCSAGADGKAGTAGTAGTPGGDGADAADCTVTHDDTAQTSTITCGTDAPIVVADGTTGDNGGDCSAVSDGTEITISCEGQPDVVVPTASACDLFVGDFSAATNADMEAIRGCRQISGQLSIDSPAVTDFSALANLEVVGALDISAATGAVSLPRLRRVDRDFEIYAEGVTSFAVPALTSVIGGVYLGDMPLVTTMSLPGLALIGGYLDIEANLLLTGVDLPLLTSLGGNGDAGPYFYLVENEVLTSFSAPLLTSIEGEFEVSSNPLLATFVLPLATFQQSEDFIVENNPAIASCRFPYLAADSDRVSLADNAPSDGTDCDNCPGVANDDQADTDRDGIGDACEP
jgi:hypothetical protein